MARIDASPEDLHAEAETLKKRLAQVTREHTTLRSILRHMPVMIDAFDTRGLIVAWNHECERVTGYAAKEILRNPKAMELLYPDATYREEMMGQWQRRGNSYYNWEWKITAKDGTSKTVLWSNISAQFPIPGWTTWGIGVDVTLRDEMRQQLEAYHAKMARTEQLASVGTFSATLAHELSQDLTAVRLPIQTALATLRNRDDPEGVRNDLKEACAAVEKTVSRLTQVKRLARRSWQDYVKYIALDEICRRILALLNSAMEQVGLTVQLECKDEPVMLWANESDMEQIFFSLIENAIQAVNTDRKNRLIIRISQDDTKYELRFRDDGVGIGPEHLDKVFDPFFTTKASNVGTGLGLFIVKNIVERAKGRIQVESSLGEGTTVTLVLPTRSASEISLLSRGPETHGAGLKT